MNYSHIFDNNVITNLTTDILLKVQGMLCYGMLK